MMMNYWSIIEDILLNVFLNDVIIYNLCVLCLFSFFFLSAFFPLMIYY